MFCKHCGKQIANDSKFCQHCGGEQDIPIEEIQKSKTTESEVLEKHEQLNCERNNGDVTKNKKSYIANEIVENLKMVGIAVSLFAIYMIIFMLAHQKDIKEYDYLTHKSYYGESCYDPSTLTGNWKFHWEQHYYEKLYFGLHNFFPVYVSKEPAPERFLEDAKKLQEEVNKKKIQVERLRKNQPKVEGVATYLDLEVYKLESLDSAKIIKEAKEDATRDIQSWNDTINNYRKWGYEDDLKKNALYAALVSSVLTIIGRYFIKLVRWVESNRTK